jgi:hypothetical protein
LDQTGEWRTKILSDPKLLAILIKTRRKVTRPPTQEEIGHSILSLEKMGEISLGDGYEVEVGARLYTIGLIIPLEWRRLSIEVLSRLNLKKLKPADRKVVILKLQRASSLDDDPYIKNLTRLTLYKNGLASDKETKGLSKFLNESLDSEELKRLRATIGEALGVEGPCDLF